MSVSDLIEFAEESKINFNGNTEKVICSTVINSKIKDLK